MKTLYAACLSRLGLSQIEAAAYHGVPLPTIKSWAQGRRTVPPGIWAELRAYEAAIVDRSEAIREAWEDSGEQRDIEARVADHAGLMGLVDFVLTTDEVPPVKVTIRSGYGGEPTGFSLS
jgi:hypothetical protein